MRLGSIESGQILLRAQVLKESMGVPQGQVRGGGGSETMEEIWVPDRSARQSRSDGARCAGCRFEC